MTHCHIDFVCIGSGGISEYHDDNAKMTSIAHKDDIEVEFEIDNDDAKLNVRMFADIGDKYRIHLISSLRLDEIRQLRHFLNLVLAVAGDDDQ